MKKIARLPLKFALAASMITLYGAVLLRAAELHLESPEVGERLAELSRCSQPALARSHHHGAGVCFRWERTRLLTGDAQRCVEADTAVAELPRCQAAKRQIAELGVRTPEQLAAARLLLGRWEQEYEDAHHDGVEWTEHRAAVRSTAGLLERADWAVVDTYAGLESRWVNLVSAATRLTTGLRGEVQPADAASASPDPIDGVLRARLRVYWEATQVPAECLLP